MSARKKMVFVVGLGRFGFSLCERLVALGQHVVGVDRSRQKVEVMADLIDYSAMLEATDEDALIKVGAKEADVAVVTIGENVEASILATAILKGLDIPLVVARAQSALHARVLSRVGAHRVIFPERDMGDRVAEQVVYPWLSNFSQLPGNDFLVGELSPLPEMVGKTLAGMNFRRTYNAMVLLLDRKGERSLPGPNTVIEASDRLLIAGEKEELSKWVHELQDDGNGGVQIK